MEIEDQKVALALSGTSAFKDVRVNDFVISLRSFEGGIEHSRFAGCVSPAYTVLRPRCQIEPRYFAYAMKSVGFVSELCSKSDGIRDGKTIRYEHFASIELPVPSSLEQVSIVAFLDRETGTIDALVAEQERLIALLKEKRQALISHAVTKGLDPNAPMKDSGVAWFGTVPAHWAVTRLKHVSPMVTVGIVIEPAKLYRDEGVPALRSLNVKPGRIQLDNVVRITEESNELHRKSRLSAGDLVAVRTGQPGTTAVVPPALEGCNCVDLIVIRRPQAGDERFLCYYLGSDAAQFQVSGGAEGAIQQHFNVETAANLALPWPSRSEQSRIVEFLDAEIAKLDELAEAASITRSLLSERRSALISAAVTGKIDVRGLA